MTIPPPPLNIIRNIPESIQTSEYLFFRKRGGALYKEFRDDSLCLGERRAGVALLSFIEGLYSIYWAKK